VCDAYLSHFKASALAVAAILNALQANLCSEVPAFSEAVRKATSIEVDSDEITLLSARLEGIYSRSVDVRECGPHIIEDDEDETEENVPRVVHTNAEEDLTHNALKRCCEVVSDDETMILKRTKFDR
jgi:hypothetical protein